MAKITPLLSELAGLLKGNDFRALQTLELLKAELEDAGLKNISSLWRRA